MLWKRCKPPCSTMGSWCSALEKDMVVSPTEGSQKDLLKDSAWFISSFTASFHVFQYLKKTLLLLALIFSHFSLHHWALIATALLKNRPFDPVWPLASHGSSAEAQPLRRFCGSSETAWSTTRTASGWCPLDYGRKRPWWKDVGCLTGQKRILRQNTWFHLISQFFRSHSGLLVK